jgi:hypothetical protein
MVGDHCVRGKSGNAIFITELDNVGSQAAKIFG